VVLAGERDGGLQAGLSETLAAVFVPLKMREVEESKQGGWVWMGLPLRRGEWWPGISVGVIMRLEVYVQKTFKVKVEVMKGQDFYEREYTCMVALTGCASTVSR
jgi:hypothetical protein